MTSNTVSNKSTLIPKNIFIGTRRTSVRLEAEMWSALDNICQLEKKSLTELVTTIADRKKIETSLTSALRVFTLVYFERRSNLMYPPAYKRQAFNN